MDFLWGTIQVGFGLGIGLFCSVVFIMTVLIIGENITCYIERKRHENKVG